RRPYRAGGGESLHVGPDLQREPARRRDLLLPQAQVGERASGGERELGGDQVDPGHLLRHRVLDLEPRVRLDEGEPARVVGVEEELEGPDARVAHLRRHAHGGAGEPRAQLPGEARRRRELAALLMPALAAAVPLAELAYRAAPVAP